MQSSAHILNSAIPNGVQVSELPDGIHYDLPRQPPDVRDQPAGVWVMLFGVAFLAMGIAASIGVTWTVFFKPGGMDVIVNGVPVAHDSPEHAWGIATGYVLVLLPMICVGLSGFVHGMYVLVGRGHVEFVGIEVGQGRLHVFKQLDFWRWRRSRSLEQVRRLEVQEGLPPPAERPWWDFRPNTLQGNLLARCEGEQPLLLAAGYPVASLKPLADDLARHCRVVAAIEVQDLPADGAGPRARDASPSPQGRVALGPTKESRLYDPNRGFCLMVSAGFALMGCVLLGYLPAGGHPVWMTFGFPVAFIGSGTLLFVVFAWSIHLRKPFRHAAPGVLPDVPSEAVPVPSEAKFDWGMPYEWLPADDPTDRGGLLRPIPNYLRTGNWAIVLWMIFIALLCSIFPWIYDAPKEFWSKIGLSILIAFGGLFCGLAGAGLFIWLRKVPFEKLVPVRVDWKERVCQIGTRPDDAIPLSQVVAVQLCAACRRRDDGMDKMFQLNLVWANPDRSDAATPRYRRRNILSTTTPQGLAPVAEKFADALDVPLLHHATREHWQREREASRDRAW